MHRSKLAGFIIDCKTDDPRTAAGVRAAAVAMAVRRLPGEEGERYVGLKHPHLDLHIEVQSVSHPSGTHLDIESDDVEAEVARLETLGAKRLERVRSWWVMEAPTGQRFCVVEPTTAGFRDNASEWE